MVLVHGAPGTLSTAGTGATWTKSITRGVLLLHNLLMPQTADTADTADTAVHWFHNSPSVILL